jgi:hypothetical protein
VESDPIGLQGGSYSTYSYVADNPVMAFDAAGLLVEVIGHKMLCIDSLSITPELWAMTRNRPRDIHTLYTGFRRPRAWIMFTLTLQLTPAPVIADEAIPASHCEIEDAAQGLTDSERRAVGKSNVPFDAVTFEYTLKWGSPNRPPALPRIDKAAGIDWQQAKRMIYEGLVTTIVQTSALEIFVIGTSGKAYKAHEPAIDAALHAAKVVDPCGKFISFITE